MKNKLIKSMILLAVTCLTACKPPLWFITDDTPSYKDREELRFTHLWQRGSTDYKAINGMINAFNESDIAKELNVFVKGDGINFWDYWDKVDLSFNTGKAPDIYIHAVSTTPTRLNQLLDLTDMYEKDVAAERDTLDANEMFFSSQINDIARYDSNNHMRAWPFSSTVRVVYYNKNLFKEAGITELPTTWEELNDVAKKLTKYETPGDENSDYAQVGFDPFCAEGQYVHQWGWLTGHNYWTTDPSTGRPLSHFDDPTYISNLQKIYDSYSRRDQNARERLADFFTRNSQNGQNPFIKGKLAMMIQNEGLYATLKQAKVDFEYGVFEIPPMNSSVEKANWFSSYSIELYDNAKRNGATSTSAEQRNRGAWEFLKFLYNKENQGIIASTGFMLSNKLYYDDYIYSDPILTDLTKAIEHTKEAEFIVAAPKWTSDIQVYVNNTTTTDKGAFMTVEQAMKACQKLMQDKIDQYYAVH